MKKINQYFSSVRENLTVENTFEGFFNNIEFWLDLLGINVFDPKWFQKMPLSKKITCVLVIFLIFLCCSFAFICALTTYKDSLEDQVSSLLAGCFAVQVSSVDSLVVESRHKFLSA